MSLTRIALANLWVRRTKMLLLALGVLVAMATVTALWAITVAMRVGLVERFAEAGQRIVISPPAEEVNISYNGVAVAGEVAYQQTSLPRGVLAQVRDLATREPINVIAPRLLAGTMVAGKPGLLAGVDMNAERALQPYWQVRGEWPQPGQVLLGALVAAQAGLEPGDRVSLEGRDFPVAGVLAETGGEEDRVVFLDLSTTEEILNQQGLLSMLELAVPAGGAETGKNPDGAGARQEPAAKVTEELRQIIPQASITPVKGAREARREVVDRFAGFSRLISVVVLVIGLLIVLTTMMGSVNERTREIGIFRAIGFRRWHVMRVILTEAGLVSLLGGAGGYLLGMMVATFSTPFLAQVKVTVAWQPLQGGVVIGLALAVGLLAGFYPAWRASRLDPVEALRLL